MSDTNDTNEQSIEQLFEQMQSLDRKVRFDTILILWSILKKTPDEKIIKVVITSAKDTDSVIREIVASILMYLIMSNVSPPESLNILLELLFDPDWHVADRAATALGQLKDRRATAPLLTLLKDTSKHEFLRKSVAEALGAIGDKSAFDALLKVSQEKSRYTASSAMIALGRLGDSRAFDILMKTLTDNDKHYSNASIYGLGYFGDSRALEPLISTLQDKDYGVRSSGAEALGLLRDKRAVKPLINALKDKENDVRHAAIVALAEFESEEAIPELEKLVDQEDELTYNRESIGEAAQEAIAKIKAAHNY